MPYSHWFHLQIHRFVDSKLHFSSCLLKAVIIPNHTLGEVMLCFFCASWWTQDWWSDIDLCTKNAINKCLNWLIKSHSPYQLVSNLLNCLPWKSQIASQLLHYHSFGGFSTLIAEMFSSTIQVGWMNEFWILWLSPHLNGKSVLGEIPNAAHIRLNNDVS